MKKRVALVYGGDSSEWKISVMSGKHVGASLDRNKYDIFEIMLRGQDWNLCDSSCEEAVPVAPVDKRDFSIVVDGTKVTFDVVLIMIHGTPGENGIFQAYLERLGIPFTTCSSRVAALTFDKFSCKEYMKDLGIPLAKDILLRKGDSWSAERLVEELGLPMFVKPNDGGSSFGITKVKTVEDIDSAVESAFREGDSIIVEQFIPGRELTEGVFARQGEVVALPVTEIVPHNEYFDYEAKYLGKSEEVCPANISEDQKSTIEEYTRRIYNHFGCSGLIRIDYIMTPQGEVFFLEINPVPGMTKMSLVPVQLSVAGLSISEVFDAIIDGTV